MAAPPPPLVVGISGATRAGKSTVASGLDDAFRERGWAVTTVRQDTYMAWDAIGATVTDGRPAVAVEDFAPDDRWGFICQVRRRGGTLDRRQCVDHTAFGDALAATIAELQPGTPGNLQQQRQQWWQRRLVVAEGYQCFETDTHAEQLLHLKLWLDLPQDVARARRMASKPVQPASHFDEEIWPAHELYRARALADDGRASGSIVVIDATQPLETVVAAAVRAVEEHSRLSCLGSGVYSPRL